jgi:hypothetical protein
MEYYSSTVRCFPIPTWMDGTGMSARPRDGIGYLGGRRDTDAFGTRHLYDKGVRIYGR